MTQDVSLIARQLRRELEQGTIARERLTAATRKAEDNNYASSTKYGQQVLKGATETISKHMTKSLVNIGRGKGSVDGASVYQHLKNADREVLAVLALKVCLDVLGKEERPTLAQLTTPIGAAIEVEMKLAWYRSKDPNLFRNIQQRFHGSTGTRQKHSVYRLKFNEAGLEWKAWGAAVHHKIGAWALRSIIESTGWVEKDLDQKSTRNRSNIMRFSQEFLGLRDSIMERAMELAYCLWPMLCPPNDWSNDERGGYLTEDIRGIAPMVRGFGPASKQGSVPIQFLNNLQRQAYTLNDQVLAVANWCFDNFQQVGKFHRLQALPKGEPFNGDPVAEPERFKEWKRQRRKDEDFNAQLYQKNWRTTETMYVANMYADEPRWYCAASYDYRGRVYFQNTVLNPQGTDFDKSLIYFADEGPVNAYWLAWNVATTSGNDKISHDDRVAWTKQNIPLIIRIAEDPIGNLSDWSGMAEPWCFLASCFEYYDTVITGRKQTSGHPCGLDATCSGLQHLASMTRDLKAAREVNCVRGEEDKPSDGYLAVAKAAMKYIDDPEIHPFMTRKVTKRTVMTVPYGVSRDSARKYVRQALRDAGFDLSIPGRLGKIVDAVYRKAVPEVFAGPVAVMEWLQSTAMELLQTQETIQWTTPSGFVVVQDIRKPKTKRIETMLMGSVLRCQVGDGFGGPNVKGHKAAIAPNFVHALDSSLLQLMFMDWDKPFTVIHDCILGRSCDMDQIQHDIRLHHAEIYKGKPLEDWARQVGAQIPDGLIKDTLDLDLVNDSPYFFC